MEQDRIVHIFRMCCFCSLMLVFNIALFFNIAFCLIDSVGLTTIAALMYFFLIKYVFSF